MGGHSFLIHMVVKVIFPTNYDPSIVFVLSDKQSLANDIFLELQEFILKICIQRQFTKYTLSCLQNSIFLTSVHFFSIPLIKNKKTTQRVHTSTKACIMSFVFF